jgi:L-threonylcarbamoyladenylate synthase
MDAATLQAALAGLPVTAESAQVAVYARHAARAPACVFVQPMPGSAAATAHELFAVLRALDARGVAEIWVETPPADSAWDGVRDRLQRAAA